MSDPKKAATDTVYDGDTRRVAERLFAERSMRANGRDMRSVAVGCFRDAAVFADVATAHELGMLESEIVKPTGPQLCDVSAPNLHHSHPHNLVSRRFGDLKKVAVIYADLKANPDVEMYVNEQLMINWDREATKLARLLFGEYIVDTRKPQTV
jgi:hypothetical protein